MEIGIMGPAGLGGSARITVELSVHLARRGHRVHLFARTTPFTTWEPTDSLTLHRAIEDDRSETPPGPLHVDVDWPAREFNLFLSRLLEVIGGEGLDLLHFHYALPFAHLAAATKHRLGDAAPALIGTLHGTDVSILGREPRRQRALVRSFRALDGLTTVSFHHARLAAGVFGLARLPDVIPNFVDLSRFRPPRKAGSMAAGQGPSGRPRPRIVHASNFRAVKDPESMARIFLGIHEKIDAELWLLGDGPEMGGIKSFFRQAGAEDDVRYWGSQRDVAPILARCDLLLMTSLTENFSLAALEAMACGVPVLTTDVGGMSELIVDGETGFLFPVGDHASAVALGAGLLSDAARHEAFRKAAVARASRFGSRKVIASYERLYRKVLESRSREPDRLSPCTQSPPVLDSE